MAAHVASEVKAAVAAALQVAFAGHHEDLVLAPTTTSTPTAPIADSNPVQQQDDATRREAIKNTDANAVADFCAGAQADYPRDSSAATLTFSPSAPHAPAVPLVASTPTSVLTPSVISDLALMAPISCSTECPGGDKGATGATAAPSASTTGVIPSVWVVQDGSVRLATSCLQPRDMLDCVLSSMAIPVTSPVHHPIAWEDCTVAMASPSVDITLSPRAPTPTATKPVASAVLESDLIKTMPSMREYDQMMVCSSLEWPLTLITARVVVGDHRFVIGVSAIPFTLAALVVDDGHVANTYEVLSPVKLLELSPFETKEQNVSPLLPQVTQAMVSRGTSMNECEAKIKGRCSSLSYPTANSISISLFQWDPREQTRASRNLVVSKDITFAACVKELTEDLSPSNCVQQVIFQNFLLGSFCAAQSNFHLLYPKVFLSLSLAANSVPYHRAQVTAGMGFLYGYVSRPWEFAGSSLFDIWRAIQSTCKPWPSWEKSLLVFTVVRATFGNCLNIVPPLRIRGEGAIGLQDLRELYDKQCCSCKGLQFVHDTSSDSECFSWEIAWCLVETSCACSEHRGSGHVTSKHKLFVHGVKFIFIPSFQSPFCCTALQSIRDAMKFPSVGIIFPYLPAATAPDSNGTSEILMDLHNSLGLILLGVLVVWTHITLVKITQWHYRGLNLWDYPTPRAYQIMLKRYKSFYSRNTFGLGLLHGILLQYWLHSSLTGHNIQCSFELVPWLFWKIFFLVPEVARIASNYSHDIVLLGSVIGEGGSIFSYVGWLHANQLRWLPWQCVSYKKSLSKSFLWYIAWLRVNSCACSEFDGSGTLTHMRKYFRYGEELLSTFPFPFFFCTIAFKPTRGTLIIQPTVVIGSPLSSYSITGDHVQWGSALLQRKVPWFHPLLGSWFQTLSTGNGFLYGFGPEQFQWKIAWSTDLDYHVIVNKLRLAVPWDPGLGGNVTAQGIFLDQVPVSHNYYPGLTFYFDKVCTDHDYYINLVQVGLGHDYDLDIFLEKVCIICYLNLVKLYLDYGTCRDLFEVMKLQVPWDPGDLTRHQLGVKPKFKERKC